MGFMGEVTPGLLHELAGIAGPLLRWSEQQTRQEVERTVEILREEHGMKGMTKEIGNPQH